ncbi:MAG: hypothetical protein C0596_19035 [Marinilabiliales bacterium]|nr:MAG: hypothetical protein C0596_19035 [Marinilabiliales bacterium]
MQKQTYIFLFLILILIAGLNSCTIEKRSYQPGYYVDWHNVNRKSDANPENNSVEQQETASYENKIKKNNVEKIEDFIQPIAIQKIEPVYASNNENINDIEVVNTTDQNSTLTRNPQKHEVIIEDTKVLSGNTGEKEMHWSTKAGFILSILSTSAIIGSFLDGLMLYLFLTLV